MKKNGGASPRHESHESFNGESRQSRSAHNDVRYKLLFHKAPIGIFQYDTNLVIIECNDFLINMLGSTREQMIGLDLKTLRDQAILPALRTSLSGREGFYEGPYISTTGDQRIYASMRATPLTDSTQKVIGGVGIVHDITELQQREDELRESRERYRVVIENATDIIFRTDDTGRISFVNPIAAKILGYNEPELIGKHYLDFVREDYRKEAERFFGIQFVKKIDNTYAEYPVVTKDGRKLWFGQNVQLIVRNDKAIGFQAVSRDITERKKLEEELRTSEEKHRSIIENIEEGYFEVDLKGNLLFFNDPLCRMFSYTADELQGMNYRKLADKETANRVFETFNSVFRTGEPSKAFDWLLIRKDGRKIAIETSVSLVRDNTGNPVGFRGVARDITERKRSEELLRESEKKYRELVENMRDVFYIADENGILTYISPVVESIAGYRPVDVLGQRITSLVHPDHAPRVIKQFRNIIADIVEPGEYRITTKNGRAIWVRTFAQPRYDEKNRTHVIGVQGIMTDITDLKQAQEELLTHQEHLELINKILRHDLINDLAAIHSALNLFRNERDEKLLAEASKKIEKSVSLIRRMRELESFIAAHHDLKICDLVEVIDRVAATYPALTVTVTNAPCRVLADESLDSVIDNIVSNALIHGKARNMTVKTEKTGNVCNVFFSDDGKGIPKEVRDHIFEEGFTYGDTGRTGLGLHIVKKAMTAYGGDVYVDESSRKGASLVLRFRIVE